MAENCSSDCSSCRADCTSRKKTKADFQEKSHELSRIKKVIGVVSGKGGVGKSMVTSLLAVAMQRRGYKVAVLDADITGPSIPRAFGLNEKATGSEAGLFPVKSQTGIPIMSLNLLVENETDPVVWRGPVIAGTVKQFWTDVIWGDVDFMFVDMPPGTGDVPLTVFQSLPVDGIVLVTTPQELVTMIVEKAANMAAMMQVPVLALVENMSYVLCPDCGKEIRVFGESHGEANAKKHDIDTFDRLPMDPSLSAACDQGRIEWMTAEYLGKVAERLAAL